MVNAAKGKKGEQTITADVFLNKLKPITIPETSNRKNAMGPNQKKGESLTMGAIGMFGKKIEQLQ